MRLTKEQAALIAGNWPAFAQALKESESDGDLLIVRLPGAPAETHEPVLIRRIPRKPYRIGDIVTAVLKAFGVESIVRLMRPNGCGCAVRRSWMNRHDTHIQIAGWGLFLVMLAAWVLKG